MRSGQVVPANSIAARQMKVDLKADIARCKLEAKLAKIRERAERRSAIHDCLLKKGWRQVAATE